MTLVQFEQKSGSFDERGAVVSKIGNTARFHSLTLEPRVTETSKLGLLSEIDWIYHPSDIFLN